MSDLNRLRELAGMQHEEQVNEMGARDVTEALMVMMDEGVLDPRQVADAALNHMSEQEVADMAHANEFPTGEEDVYGESINESDGMESFKPEYAMNISQVDKRFGNVRDWKDIFKNGAGVYMADTGSRGELENISYVGKGPGFDYDTYGGVGDNWEPDDEDDEDGYADDEGGYEDEFTSAEWDGNVFEVGRSEEEADVYFYWNGK